MTLVIKKRAEGWLIYKVRKSGRTLPVPERLRPARGLWRKEMKTERQTAYGNPFGTYVLTRNLIYSLPANVAPGSPGSPPPAITISSTTPGQIVLDLKGFRITGTVGLRIDTDS